MAIFWTTAGLLAIAPIVVAAALVYPDWYLNAALWVVVGPGILGALLLGPAWFWRRRKLLREEGLTVSGQAQASESRSRSAPRMPGAREE